MKNVEYYDIIYLTVRWNYMNNNMLISTAMLNAFWEKEKKDTLEQVYLPGKDSIILYKEKEVHLNRLKLAKRDGKGSKRS